VIPPVSNSDDIVLVDLTTSMPAIGKPTYQRSVSFAKLAVTVLSWS
jgi:hypothetical protein